MSFVIVGGILTAGAAAAGAISANKQKKEAEEKEAAARAEMEAIKDTYRQLDTSNPYLDMENTMEDLTINQRQFDLETQQFSQSQSNILSGLGEAAGSSGIAGVAQALANQGQIAAQKTAAQIGSQERQNQMAERQMAANIQQQEREGEVWSRNAERDKQATLLGMAQQETAAYAEQAAAAEQAKWDSIQGGISGLAGMFGGGGGGSGGFRSGGGGGQGGHSMPDCAYDALGCGPGNSRTSGDYGQEISENFVPNFGAGV
jgi:hypothetical protein